MVHHIHTYGTTFILTIKITRNQLCLSINNNFKLPMLFYFALDAIYLRKTAEIRRKNLPTETYQIHGLKWRIRFMIAAKSNIFLCSSCVLFLRMQ